VTLPIVDVATVAPAALLGAMQRHGAVLATHPRLDAMRGRATLRDVAAFFRRPAEAKEALAISRSPHFRGYSRMHNERDWREQIHFGRDRDAVPGEAFWRLQGPNLWPDDPPWTERMREWMHDVTAVGEQLLAGVAAGLGLDHRGWLGADPYVLTKCIGYHAQPDANERRRGVAAHLDFSLVTLTLQDDVGGLEVRDRDGRWLAVPPVDGALLVNVGELLQFVCGNRLVATPHRVVNPSRERSRCSVPVFVCPSLDTTLVRPAAPELVVVTTEHVHEVLDPAAPPATLHFGRAEWRRKGENGWCRVCAPAGVQDRGASMLERRVV